METWLIILLAIILIAAFIPFAMRAMSRGSTKSGPATRHEDTYPAQRDTETGLRSPRIDDPPVDDARR